MATLLHVLRADINCYCQLMREMLCSLWSIKLCSDSAKRRMDYTHLFVWRNAWVIWIVGGFFFLEELTCLLFFVQKVSFQFSTTGLLRHRCIISTLTICQDSGYKYTGWLIGQLSARTILSHTHISIFIQEVFLLILFPTSPFPI